MEKKKERLLKKARRMAFWRDFFEARRDFYAQEVKLINMEKNENDN